jgi:hypothetical protein
MSSCGRLTDETVSHTPPSCLFPTNNWRTLSGWSSFPAALRCQFSERPRSLGTRTARKHQSFAPFESQVTWVALRIDTAKLREMKTTPKEFSKNFAVSILRATQVTWDSNGAKASVTGRPACWQTLRTYRNNPIMPMSSCGRLTDETVSHTPPSCLFPTNRPQDDMGIMGLLR